MAAGADPKARDAAGKTPWDLAPKDSNAYWLLGDPKARNSSGQTPWDNAKDNDALKGSDAYWRLNDARF
jgi:hypothetical protein